VLLDQLLTRSLKAEVVRAEAIVALVRGNDLVSYVFSHQLVFARVELLKRSFLADAYFLF